MKTEAGHRDDWLLVDQDECWFSRFAQPRLHAFAGAQQNLRLVQREPAPGEIAKAIACYGAVCAQTKERYVCLVEGRPNSETSIAFLSTLLGVAKALGKRLLIVIWDRASWHTAKQVTGWIRQHNRQAKRQTDGVRLLTCLLPTKSPWLNPMEPIWRHAKRNVVEPDGDLTVKELTARLCAHFHITPENAFLKVSD